MHLQESGEMYLETIYRLTKTRPDVRAIDVCEHAYFADYGFDKQRYLISALPYLDITKLTLPTRRVGTT